MSLKSKLQNYMKQMYRSFLDKHEAAIVKQVLEKEDFEAISEQKIVKFEEIAIVVGSIVRFSGGHTSMLRLGTGLEKLGKKVTYVSFNNQEPNDMKEVAEANLAGVKGSFTRFCEVDLEKFDVVIATSWQSVYYAKRFRGYKVYFVQDYEPYFFELNERYLLAKKTYELGFHIISLGKWNLEQIAKNCDLDSSVRMDFISFPYEPKEYTIKNRDYKEYESKKRILLAVYTKEDGKRIPNLLQIIIKKATDELAQKGIVVETAFFGLNERTKVTVGKNLGKLNQKQMMKLYSEADFGVVASMTNISLVPYEMLATGLPVIEFKEGSFPCFFDAEAAILIDYNYRTLVAAIEESLSDSTSINRMMEKAQENMRGLSWENSVLQFKKILDNVLEEK